MLLGALARGEKAGRLDDHVDAEVGPRQCRRVTFCEHLERGAVHADPVAVELDPLESAVRRVVVEQVCENVRRSEVVDGNHVELPAAVDVSPKKVATDATEAVDANLECHSPPRVVPESL